MSAPVFMFIVGLLAAGVGVRELYYARKRGYIRMRGGLKVYYAKRPRLFWINAAATAALTILGLVLMAIAVRR